MIPAAPLESARAESTPIYGEAADAVTVRLALVAGVGFTTTDGSCVRCATAGLRCLVGATPSRSIRDGREFTVWPLSLTCDGVINCDDCAEVAEAIGVDL